MAWAEKLRSGRYRGVFRTKKGERRSTGDTFTRKADAKRVASDLEAQSRKHGWHDPKNGDITWAEWRLIWEKSRQIEGSTKRNEASMIDNWIAPHWDDAPLAEITRHDVQEWINEVRTTNTRLDKNGEPDDENPKYLSTASVRRYLTPFVASLTAAMDAGRIPANPALRIKLPPIAEPHRVFLSKAEYAALVSKIPSEADKAVCDFLVSTGLRWGELAGLHEHRIDLANGSVVVQEVWDGEEIKPYPKGGRQRRVPLVDWGIERWNPRGAMRCGQTHREGTCRAGLAFPAVRGGGVRNDRNFTRDVLAPALKAAGLADLGFTLHDFRHTYASWLAQDGKPLAQIAELLGHASTSTTEIYAHFRPAETSDVERALSRPCMANAGQTSETPGVIALHQVRENREKSTI